MTVEQTADEMLQGLLQVRGVTAAALVSVDGELLAGKAHEESKIDQVVGLVTSALAAGRALADMLVLGGPATVTWLEDEAVEGEHAGEVDDEPPAEPSVAKQMMVVFEDGPVLFTPLPGGERVCVVALASQQDLGRARYRLRGQLGSLAAAKV